MMRDKARAVKEALIQGGMAGGDNSARSMEVGIVLGAYFGEGYLPEKWVTEHRKAEEINNLLDQIG